ncbi:ABC transporter ATP-binding protein [Peribacillus acanthi]|uniref:ABC transporter ATP-binding protein n=1 Tax=Peribacillus acanthi TaxID=2171554 RepID=UPI001F0BE3A4|nr:ABC transporter ATP-binding protein [Peribacillus acanthi]
MLTIDSLSYSFDGKEKILENLNLEVKEGEFVSILGPSGSGKSTLFQLIGGMLKPDRGSISLQGKSLIGARGHISYMPQQPALLPWRNILDNVLLGADISGQVDREKAISMLGRAGFGKYKQDFPHQLSGGMKQRVAFLRTLLSPQSFMCLDEPFSALDELTRLEMQQWLLSIWEKDRRSVLFITHSMEEAIFLSDRILVLSNKPAKVIHEMNLNFSRPRSKELLLSKECLDLKRELYALLETNKQGEINEIY